MTNALENFYHEKIAYFSQQISEISKKTTTVSWARVIIAVVILLLIYLLFKNPAFIWLVILGVVGYAYLVSIHEKLKYQLSIARNHLTINEAEVKALHGDITSFGDGRQFINGQHHYTVDLDIFGKGSIFQLLNRTSSEPGSELLAGMLGSPLKNKSEILNRQEAVKELGSKTEFRQMFQAIGMTSGEKKNDHDQLLDWLKLDSLVFGKPLYQIALIAFPIFSISTLLLWIFAGMYLPFILVSLIQWGIIGSHAKRVTLIQNYIGDKRFLFEKYSEHFRLLQKEEFKTSVLQEITSLGKEAERELAVLSSRSRALDLRLNFFASLFLNTTMLYDLFAVYRLEQWRNKNKEHLKQWLEAVQQADALIGLGTFHFNHPQFIFPEITETNHLHAEKLGHPLIPAEKRIDNQLDLGKNANLWIVTGANMAGKSTYLRAVGVNVVLALSGSVVCAKSMQCPLIEIFTGMRNTDSINENQSYFFAELLRLHHIVEELKTGKRLLILLDEILKGTNSGDKLSGSLELMQQLSQYNCIGMVATHDIDLGVLETKLPGKIANWHFETFIKGDELSFDYTLHPGVSTSKNATFLMKKMGIIPDNQNDKIQ